jgi:hypothetical protein
MLSLQCLVYPIIPYICKKGDANSLNDYRAIAVCAVLDKLYNMPISYCIFCPRQHTQIRASKISWMPESVCAEKNGWRAEGLVSGQARVQWTMVWSCGTWSTQFMKRSLVVHRFDASLITRRHMMKSAETCWFSGLQNWVYIAICFKQLLRCTSSFPWILNCVMWSDPAQRGHAVSSKCDPLSPMLFGLCINRM